MLALSIAALGFWTGKSIEEPAKKRRYQTMGTDIKTNGFCDELELKAVFVGCLNTALISNGDGRYDYLKETPLTYSADGLEEYVTCGGKRACVTGDSLTAIMADISEQLF